MSARPRVGVVTFPGSLDDRDALRAITLMGGDAVPVWHTDRSLAGAEAIVL
ncbi:MAG TPA: phosphoribosylformylglycinamidine synthase subunit PurQ, partial [Actinomycetota bacterium]|nr:phosphoribosylformylglycinamidine synthase subunit PurQ [Actinomycetota bacterium]